MVVEGFTGTVECCLRVRASDFDLPAFPGTDLKPITGVEGVVVDVVHARCAGIDVSKRDAKVCIRIAGAARRGASQTVTTWGSVTNQILALRDHLLDQRVTCVVMEATGDYWKPFYYLLEGACHISRVSHG